MNTRPCPRCEKPRSTDLKEPCPYEDCQARKYFLVGYLLPEEMKALKTGALIIASAVIIVAVGIAFVLLFYGGKINQLPDIGFLKLIHFAI